MDLDHYQQSVASQESGFRVALKDPVTGEETGGTITMCGPDTRRAYLAKQEVVRKAVSTVTEEGRALTDEEREGLSTLYIAKCALGWEGITRGGEPVPFSEAAVQELFWLLPWVQTQCDAGMSLRGNFTTS